MDPAPPTFRLTRFFILRLLGFVYFFAFLSLARQVLPLIGQHGLEPASKFLQDVQAQVGRGGGFVALPSLFWLRLSDGLLVAGAWTGLALSVVVLAGFANAILLAVLWALYMSYVHIGQEWYGYGWEIQLLETGFLAIFLCPLLDMRPFPKRPPPTIVLWLFRWLSFRIMLGAGLIKLRGDPCWRNLTCLDYHFETQPIPNPLSRWFHFLPEGVHRGGVVLNHLAEVAAPWFVFAPGVFRTVAGCVIVAFQIVLILSGNLSFLNYLTIIPALACFDDAFWARVMPVLAKRARDHADIGISRAQRTVAFGLLALVVILSVGPVANLLSPNQVMNTGFDPLDLVNTYGAFGTVGEERREIVFEGTADSVVTDSTRWVPYEFPYKPGDPMRRPGLCAPYQPRLDWSIWFAAMSTPRHYLWTLHFVWKLLHDDAGTLSLLAGNPFPNAPPRFIRAELYRYEFARPGEAGGAWWKRSKVGLWLPPLSVDEPEFRRVLEAKGWVRSAD